MWKWGVFFLVLAARSVPFRAPSSFSRFCFWPVAECEVHIGLHLSRGPGRDEAPTQLLTPVKVRPRTLKVSTPAPGSVSRVGGGNLGGAGPFNRVFFPEGHEATGRNRHRSPWGHTRRRDEPAPCLVASSSHGVYTPMGPHEQYRDPHSNLAPAPPFLSSPHTTDRARRACPPMGKHGAPPPRV